MSLAQTQSVALLGLDGHIVGVEVDIADGLPGYALLGLPDAALSESRDRVRSAIVNCGEVWPNRKVTVSLSPAWLPKSGSSFDLAICISLLSAHQTVSPEKIADIVFLGELSLDGRIRSVRDAAELFRPVMAIPGPINSPTSEGCHRLIGERAAEIVTSVADAVEFIGVNQ